MKSLLLQGIKAFFACRDIFLYRLRAYDIFARLSDTSRQLFVCMGIFLFLPVFKGKQRPAFHRAAARGENRRREGKVPVCACCSGAFLFLLMTICTLVRMTLLSRAAVYEQNPLSNANLFYLGFCLAMFGLFQFDFVRLL